MLRSILILLGTIAMFCTSFVILDIIIDNLPTIINCLISGFISLVYYGAKHTDNNGNRGSPMD